MTREIKIGKSSIGGNNRIAIQSMTNTRTSNIDDTLNQIHKLTKSGCDIVRVAVLSQEDALAIKEITKNIEIPLVADIHYNHNFAIMAIENGADKIRINPGNISNELYLNKIIDAAKFNNVAIRIGTNSGSVSKDFLNIYNDKATALAESLMAQVRYFEKHSFYNLVLSVKSTDVIETININKKISTLCDYPLHIGITEAGPAESGIIKNSIGIGALLLDGIGDTIRVSLTDDPEKEIFAAKNILKACGKEVRGINFISCPTCGRCMVDMVPIANEIYNRIKYLSANLTVAVMGCPVNGPGEAKDADIGIAFGPKEAILFEQGEMKSILPLDGVINNFVRIVEDLANVVG